MLHRRFLMTAVIAGTTMLAACAEREVILPGERLTLRGQEPVQLPENQAVPIALPAAQNLNAWSQSGANAANNPGHLALNIPLTPVFATSIGASEDRKHRITAQPVVADGRIFTLDAMAGVQATGTDGAVLWSRDLTPLRDKDDQASGGGLAIDGNRLIVASGFGLLAALDVSTGQVLWTQQLEAGGTGTPTVYGDLIYFVSGDNRAWALEAETGRIRWQLNGAESGATLVGGPAPAVTDQLVLFPFSDGDLVAAFRRGGVRRWDASVAGNRLGLALSQIGDITGDPVIAGKTVYIGNYSGRLVSLNLENGERNWTVGEGAQGPVAVAGGSLFLISDQNELLRLDATDGSRIWGYKLPNYTTSNSRKRAGVFAHYGPVLAGGQVVIASGDGVVRSFDPVSGAPLRYILLDGGAATAPVVVNGTLYVVSRKGKLHAFR